MGLTCCQTANNVELQNLQKVPYLSDYIQSSWPQDPNLQTLLNLSTIYKNNKQQFKVPLKHKIYNRWFWGTWSQGSPFGNGILYNKIDKNSIYYEGQFFGQPQGYGRVIYNGGDWEYKGYIMKGKANGKGKFVNKIQGFQFDGQWKQSKPSVGRLTLYPPPTQKSLPSIYNSQTSQINGPIIIDLNQTSQAMITYPDHKIYKGQINKLYYIPFGRGQIIFENKNKYKGEWMDGEMHGQGRFQWEDGSFYEGEYQYGKKHGTGRFFYGKSKNLYEGYWKDGKQHGKGILYNKNREQIKNGEWQNGVFIEKQKNKTQIQKERTRQFF